MKRYRFVASLMITGFVLTACGSQAQASPTNPPAAATQAPVLTDRQTLTIGVVSDDPAGTIETFQPLMDYLAKQLSADGVVQGSVVVVPDFATLTTKLQSGEVDLYYETAYGALYAYENAGAVPLLRGWRKGIGEYHSTIFVKKDSGITTLDGLRGQLIAFAEPDSTSGFYLPMTYLTASGFTVTEHSSAASVPVGEVGYVISGSDENVVSYVLHGNAVAGGLEYDVYDDLKPEDKDQLQVLAQTNDLPRSIMMASATMTTTLRQRVADVLKAAADTDEGKAALKGAKKTTLFDELPMGPQATMDALQALFGPVK